VSDRVSERLAGSAAMEAIPEEPLLRALLPPRVRLLGLTEYEPTWRAMQRFTDGRDAGTPDEIWLLEHPSVFTLGMAASPEHVLAPGDIPVVRTDRGGQVTYHGPGQLVVYPLIDIRRAGLGVRDLVSALERSVVDLLAERGIVAETRCDAPGVYVNGRKLASVGLRIRRGASYHGLALNVDMDLAPFSRINPCGYRGLEMTQLRELPGSHQTPDTVAGTAAEIAPRLLAALGLARPAAVREGLSSSS
jgi:lipoyl(octanoyl) transferase